MKVKNGVTDRKQSLKGPKGLDEDRGVFVEIFNRASLKEEGQGINGAHGEGETV